MPNFIKCLWKIHRYSQKFISTSDVILLSITNCYQLVYDTIILDKSRMIFTNQTITSKVTVYMIKYYFYKHFRNVATTGKWGTFITILRIISFLKDVNNIIKCPYIRELSDTRGEITNLTRYYSLHTWQYINSQTVWELDNYKMLYNNTIQ